MTDDSMLRAALAGMHQAAQVHVAAPRQELMRTCAEEALGLLQACVVLTRPRPEGA